ncbi:MAG: RHS repeat-associated core domain-containing protein [Verrucomicrobiota bacterium]|nr:RHS repeat-associated core domain-containing protein [Verrucomicrobiota bacterium]
MRDDGAGQTGQPGRPLLTLYDHRAREYDPWHGRFTSRDPAEYAEVLNLYQYVLSNPQAHTDPTGEMDFNYASLMKAVSIGSDLWTTYDVAITFKGAIDAFARGASLQSVALELAVELAIQAGGGKAMDKLIDVGRPLLNKFGQALGKGLKGALELEIHMHHVFPKFLKGDAGGILVGLEKRLHEKFHGGLLKALHEKGIYPAYKQTWDKYFEKEGKALLPDALKVLREYTKQFDKENGTHLLQSLLEQFAKQGVG